MSSKVIKWFKRQASIRRFTDKGEDTASASKVESGDKKKNPFTRLGTFRRKKKKKPGEDPGPSVVGISKKYSYSLPDEIESETKDPSSMAVVINSVSLENSMSSPSRMDSPTKSSVSDLSYHSSYDNEAHSSEFSRDCSPTEVDRNQIKSDNTSKITDVSNKNSSQTDMSYEIAPSNRKSWSYYKQRQDMTRENVIPIIIINEPNTSPVKPPLAVVEYYSSDDLSCLSDVEESEIIGSERSSKDNFKEIDKLVEKIQKNLNDNEISRNLESSLENSQLEQENSSVIGPNTKSKTPLSSPKAVTSTSPESYLNRKENIVVLEMLENDELVIYENDDEKCASNRESSKVPQSIINISDKMDKNGNTKGIIDNCESKKLDESKNISSITNKDESESQNSDSFNISIPNSSNSVLDADDSSIDSTDTDSEDDKATVVDKSTFNQEIDIISVTTITDSIEQGENISTANNLKNELFIVENQVDEKIENTEESESKDKSSQIHYENNEIEEKSDMKIENNIEEQFMKLNKESEVSSQKIIEDIKLKESSRVEYESKLRKIDSEINDIEAINEKLVKSENQKKIEIDVQSRRNIEQQNEHKSNVEHLINNETKVFNNAAVQSVVVINKEKCLEDTNGELKNAKLDDVPAYPTELNPFGSDDENIDNNKQSKVIPNKIENETKENGSNPFGSDTELEEEYNKLHNDSPSQRQIHDNDFCRVSTENLKDTSSLRQGSISPRPKFGRKYGEKDKRSMKPHSSVEDLISGSGTNTKPILPPKNEKRTNSSGFRVPTPRPRKLKLHGSTTSLQNISSTFPVAVPRSTTPCGSTRTLNESSTNPFADDMDDDDNDTSSGVFDRRGCGRSTMQESSTGVSFVRSNIMERGSLPPSSRVRKKKRQAPTPPSGIFSNKPPKPLTSTSSKYRSPSSEYSSRYRSPSERSSKSRSPSSESSSRYRPPSTERSSKSRSPSSESASKYRSHSSERSPKSRSSSLQSSKKISPFRPAPPRPPPPRM